MGKLLSCEELLVLPGRPDSDLHTQKRVVVSFGHLWRGHAQRVDKGAMIRCSARSPAPERPTRHCIDLLKYQQRLRSASCRSWSLPVGFLACSSLVLQFLSTHTRVATLCNRFVRVLTVHAHRNTRSPWLCGRQLVDSCVDSRGTTRAKPAAHKLLSSARAGRVSRLPGLLRLRSRTVVLCVCE